MEFTTIILIFAALGVIGVVAAVSVIVTLFTAIGKNVDEIAVSGSVPSVKDSQFLANLATISGGSLHHFNEEQSEIYTDNEFYLEKLLADIQSAKESISIVTYVWDYDHVSKRFFDTLAAAVERDVEVRLLIDAYGSTIKQRWIKEFKKAGIKVVLFRPFILGKLSQYHARVHRRAYIFDGKIGYFGGSAISKQWFRNKLNNDFTYQDVMYRVEGELVQPIAGAFGELWSTYASELAQQLYAVPEVKQVHSEYMNAFSLAHVPRLDVHPLTSTMWYCCMAAKSEIVVISPYFVPGEALAELLKQKAKSGVSVKIVTQGTSEVWFVQAAARSYYSELLEAGVEIFEHTEKHMHTKVLVIDKSFTLCGSANFDLRSQRINHEFVIGVQSETFAAKNLNLLEKYNKILKKIDINSWTSRGIHQRVIEKIARTFSEQF